MRALFIGNSFTYVNSLPSMVQALSRGAGKNLTCASVTSGGKSLSWHWYNPETLDTIAAGGWDWVVLQDHSQQGIEDPEHLVIAVSRLAGRIRVACGEPMLFVTWAREHIPEMQETITEAYRCAASQAKARLAPVGPAFARVRAEPPIVPLYQADRSHPSWLGTYLAACVFYSALFEATPVGLPCEFPLHPGVKGVIESDLAETLQSAAWDAIVRESARRR